LPSASSSWNVRPVKMEIASHIESLIRLWAVTGWSWFAYEMVTEVYAKKAVPVPEADELPNRFDAWAAMCRTGENRISATSEALYLGDAAG
jgi:hypothetical protein